MQNIMNKLYGVFDEMGYPYYRQGSLGDGPYQDNSFLTFWNIRSELLAHYDNQAHSTSYDIQVYFYTNDFGKIYSEFDRLIELLKQNDFIIQGDGYDVASDYKTHIGRTVSVLYRKNN